MDSTALDLSGHLRNEIVASDRPAPVAPIDPRDIPARFSNLKAFAQSPRHYLHAVQEQRPDTLAMRLGRGGHAVVFGLPVVLWAGKVRNGKVWDAFRAEHEGHAEILNVKEWDVSHRIADALRSHPIASALLFGEGMFSNGVVHEQQIEWSWLGKACTSRPDARSPGYAIVDLKTTQSADPEKFRRDAIWRGYHAQLAFYALADEHETKRRAGDLYIVAIESKPPYVVTALQLTPRATEQGERLCRLWFERLLVCEQSNAWPEYSSSIVQLDAPDGDADETFLLDGGEAFEFGGAT